MKRKMLFVIIVLLFMGLGCKKNYDKQLMHTTMHEMGEDFHELEHHLEHQDLPAAAEKFSAILENNKKIMNHVPPGGDEEEWTRIHTEMNEIAAAGIAACKDGDEDTVNAMYEELIRLRNSGHKRFK